jgi:hypothetical protein
MKHFRYSFFITAVCLGIATWWGYSRGGTVGALQALGVAAILGILEVSLSFDNAVINASVLKTWNRFWQTLFLTVGMLIAVFGMRLLFPLLFVAQVAGLGLAEVWNLALNDPDAYSIHLINHHDEVAVFGGLFLLMVFLNFLLDPKKKVHWLGRVEEKIGSFGQFATIPVMVALGVLMLSLSLVEEGKHLVVLTSGLCGILTYLAVDLLRDVLWKEEVAPTMGEMVKRGGIGSFLYLEVLDASFSFDGVIGAFAITEDVVIIMLGLAIGAMYVRSMTIFLVRQGTLDKFVFLKHGANYAIGVLAVTMLAGMRFDIPDLFTGLAGVAFILTSLWSSMKYKRRMEAQQAARRSAPHFSESSRLD